MDSAVSFVLGFSLPTTLLCVTLFVGYRLGMRLIRQAQEREERLFTMFSNRENQLLVQVEGLLNRAQAKTWEQFAQASSSMRVVDPYAEVPPVGLSDFEELKRINPGAEFDLSIGGVDGYDGGDGTIGTAH